MLVRAEAEGEELERATVKTTPAKSEMARQRAAFRASRRKVLKTVEKTKYEQEQGAPADGKVRPGRRAMWIETSTKRRRASTHTWVTTRLWDERLGSPFSRGRGGQGKRKLQWRLKLPMSEELSSALDDPVAEVLIAGATITLLFCYGVQTCNLDITLDTGQVINLNPVLLAVEEFLAGVFGVELLLRWWANNCSPWFFINPLTIVDVLCVAPVYVETDGGYR